MKHERMDWETIAFMLGDLHTLYQVSTSYAERHTYNEQQRALLKKLNDCIQACKQIAEEEIAQLLMALKI